MTSPGHPCVTYPRVKGSVAQRRRWTAFVPPRRRAVLRSSSASTTGSTSIGSSASRQGRRSGRTRIESTPVVCGQVEPSRALGPRRETARPVLGPDRPSPIRDRPTTFAGAPSAASARLRAGGADPSIETPRSASTGIADTTASEQLLAGGRRDPAAGGDLTERTSAPSRIRSPSSSPSALPPRRFPRRPAATPRGRRSRSRRPRPGGSLAELGQQRRSLDRSIRERERPDVDMQQLADGKASTRAGQVHRDLVEAPSVRVRPRVVRIDACDQLAE